MFEAIADKRRLLICKYYEPFKLWRRIRQGEKRETKKRRKDMLHVPESEMCSILKLIELKCPFRACAA